MVLGMEEYVGGYCKERRRGVEEEELRSDGGVERNEYKVTEKGDKGKWERRSYEVVVGREEGIRRKLLVREMKGRGRGDEDA